MRYLQMLLERRPHNKSARWLLNVAAMTVEDHPDAVPSKLLIPVNQFDGTAQWRDSGADAEPDVL